eukprot:NODE_18100_length_910_cov_6.176245.p1 GENE.NODE_18100_length_910_cov_6.176245~~NODE_18100_length_910_cov_6.176245.p1  ORF type:complete len:232 (+),score=11.42 NODE_18100_length_910_cov_6.176245:79-774(+)
MVSARLAPRAVCFVFAALYLWLFLRGVSHTTSMAATGEVSMAKFRADLAVQALIYAIETALAVAGQFTQITWLLRDYFIHHGTWSSCLCVVMAYDHCVASASRMDQKTLWEFRVFLLASLLTNVNEGLRVAEAGFAKSRERTGASMKVSERKPIWRVSSQLVVSLHLVADAKCYYDGFLFKAWFRDGNLEVFEAIWVQLILYAAWIHVGYWRDNHRVLWSAARDLRKRMSE